VRRGVLKVLYHIAIGGLDAHDLSEEAGVSEKTVVRIIKDARDVGFVVQKDERGRVYLYLPE